MGERSLTCIFEGGEYRLAQYGQWGAAPERDGKIVYDVCKNAEKREALRRHLNLCRLIPDTAEFYKSNNLDKLSAEEFAESYPALCTSMGADVLDVIIKASKPVYTDDYLDFANHSLLCEWAYVIDYDDNLLEVFRGFNKYPIENIYYERFYSERPDIYGYYPVRFVAAFHLDDLPPTAEEFIKDVYREADEECPI